MAAPNLVNVANIFGRTLGYAVTTSNTAVLANPAGSNKVFKVSSILVSNINGTASADLTIDLFKNQTTQFYLGYTLSVPADSTLVVLSRDSAIYLEENDSIRMLASTNSYLHATIAYEELS